MALTEMTDAGMLFVRYGGDLSHHPVKSVARADALAGLRAWLRFLFGFEAGK